MVGRRAGNRRRSRSRRGQCAASGGLREHASENMRAGGEEQSGAVAERAPAELSPAALGGPPAAAQVTVTRSRVHIGPKIVSVTQNVHNERVVRGRVLGLWLQARSGGGTEARRLRCSVAVCVCWPLVLAVALAGYLAWLALAAHPTRIQLETSAWRVVCAWARATSRGERLACASALAVLALCAAAAGVLATRAPAPVPDIAPHEWNITREQWLADARTGGAEPWPERFLPLRLVVVQHTVGPQCHWFADCAAIMRNLQTDFLNNHNHTDLPYNFVVGNDARVYEGRGWTVVGAHTRGYNLCALGLGFTGNYHNESGGAVPTAAQQRSAHTLLADGVRLGWLHARHAVLGARDVRNTVSPGDALYAALRQWPEAPPDPRHFYNRTCDHIYEELLHKDAALTPSPARATRL